jgi:hypothetical protein
MLTPDAPKINPLIPKDWKWVGLRDLPYHGAYLTYFLVREGDAGFRVYSTQNVDSDWGVELYNADVSESVQVFHASIVVIAMQREGGMVILLGNTSEATVFTPVATHGNAPPNSRFLLRIYNSERGAWEPGVEMPAAELQHVSVGMEAGGFRLLEITAQT